MRSLLLLLLLSGCHLQPRARFRVSPAIPQVAATREECAKLDEAQLGWTVSATVFGALSGGSGGVTALIPDDVPKYVVGSVSLGLGLLTAVSTLLASVYTRRYADLCTVNTGGR